MISIESTRIGYGAHIHMSSELQLLQKLENNMERYSFILNYFVMMLG